MTSTPLDQRRMAAVRIAREAGALAMGYFVDHSRLGVSLKGSQDWLTVADGVVEHMIRTQLLALHPGDTVLGEEGGGSNGERLWIVDPIDGTANFARGDRLWCISIGYVENGVPEIGVVFAPALDEMWVAQRGFGATMNDASVNVAPTTDIHLATVEIGWSTRRPQADYLRLVEQTMTAGASGQEVRIRRARHGACRQRTHGRLSRVAHQFVGCRGGLRHREGGRRGGQRFFRRRGHPERQSDFLLNARHSRRAAKGNRFHLNARGTLASARLAEREEPGSNTLRAVQSSRWT